MTAIGYIRTSQDRDDACSLSSQAAGILEYCEEHGLTLESMPAQSTDRPDLISLRSAGMYPEEFTGRELDRPELNRVKQLMRQHQITDLVVYDASRFARKIAVADILLDEIFACGVRLHLVSWEGHVKDTTRDRHAFLEESLLSHRERENIVERMQRGKKDRLTRGIWLITGWRKYGYQLTGEGLDTRLARNEEELAIVATVFEMRLSGQFGQAIADHLTRQRVVTPGMAVGQASTQTKWQMSMVNRILGDRAYTGVFTFKNTHKGKQTAYAIEYPELRVISEEAFDQVQQMRHEGNRKLNRKTQHEYLLARLGNTCMCGYSMQATYGISAGNYYLYYLCNRQTSLSRKRGVAPCANVGHWPAKVIDNQVWTWIVGFLNDPERMAATSKEAQARIEAANHDATQDVELARKNINKHKEKLARYAEMYGEGAITKELWKEKQSEIDRQIREAESMLHACETKIESNDIAERLTDVTRIRDRYDRLDNLLFPGRRAIIERLGMTFQFGIDEKGRWIDIVWHGRALDRVQDTDVLQKSTAFVTLTWRVYL